MKTNLASALLLAGAAAFAVHTASASAPTATARGFTITQVARGDGAQIVRGVPELTVLRLMSTPACKLADNVWVYQNHPVASDRPEARDCDVLVLTFANGKLADMKIVNRHGVDVIAASLKLSSEATRLVQK